MVYENEQIGGASGEGVTGANGTRVRDHLKAAGAAAGEAARQRTEQAQEWARSRSNQAGEWARTQLSDVQGRVQANPQRAMLYALGAGLALGLVLAGLLRIGQTHDRA